MNAATEIARLFGTGLSQHARLITLASAQKRGLPESLAVEQLTGREAVNELFSFEVDALSLSTDLDLWVFIGEELTVALLQHDRSRRAWHGICTEASWLGADGGLARYRLRLEPALALLALRRDSYIFQDMNARISSWDPAQLVAPAAEQQSILDAGDLPALPIYDGSGERIASDRGAADPHSVLMLQALELDNKAFEGAGAVRRLAAGHVFHLTQHERYPAGDNAFTVLWVCHEARNNFQTGIAGGAQAGVENGTYRNTFGCVRDAMAIVPRATAAPHPSTALGPQTAIVVGLADSVSTTTRDHQVKIQFAWQRGPRSNPGGLSHDTDERGNAPGDETSGTWVRVAEALAGPNWGSLFTPRLGTEVLVDFLEGDIDRPVIVAQLYNGADTPPFAAGVDSGVNHAGVLSGIHSHNFDKRGYNQWQLDDTPGQLRTRLATSCAATQLNLGYLIQQAPPSAHRGSYRGSGFELRTDAWGVVRGGEGVLLSTSARARQGSGVASTQMDTAEALSLFKGAKALSERLTEAAAQQQALFSKDAEKAQADFIEQIDPKAKGKFAGAVNGQQAAKAKGGGRELDAGQPVEKFGSSIVLMDSAASINWATPASTVIYAGQQLHWTTQSDLHMAAAHTVLSVAANAANLFAHSGGIQAIAGNGPVSLQAHTDQLEILADQSITVISVNDSIEIKAKEKIVLQAGQSSITLDGGNITFACPGKFTVKGGQHLFDGGSSTSAPLEALPFHLATIVPPGPTVFPNYDEQIVYKDTHGDPVAEVPFHVRNQADETQHLINKSPKHGALDRFSTSTAQPLEYALRYTEFKIKK